MVKRIFSYSEKYTKYYILAIIITFLETLFQMAMPIIMADMIDNGIVKGDISYIFQKGILMVGMAIISFIFGRLAVKFASLQAMGFGDELRKAQFKSIQELSFAQIDKFKSSTLITRLTADITKIQLSLLMSARMFVRAPMMLITALVLSSLISLKLATIFMLAVPVLAIGIGVIVYLMRPIFMAMQEAMDDINSGVQENLTGIRVVKSFNQEEKETEDFVEKNAKLQEVTLKAFGYIIYLDPFVQIITAFTTVAIVWFGAGMLDAGELEIGELSTFITYINQIMFGLIMLSFVVLNISRSFASLKRVFEVIDAKSEIFDIDPDKDLEIKEGAVEFKNVFFKYFQESEDYVLKDINFKIRPGEKIGIIGGTGSGKSSLVQLIARLYDVSSGEIIIDARPIKDYSLENLRKGVSMVLQKNTLFSGPIIDNLRLGKQDASIEEINRALEISGAKEFVDQLPGGLDYELEQEAKNLSGGQKQRLCIARALITRPKILILDDSTSAVDTKTEAKIQKGIMEELGNITVITIAQRISSIENSDQIFVMDDGKIVNQGKHQDLLLESEIYKEIYDGQVKVKKDA